MSADESQGAADAVQASIASAAGDGRAFGLVPSPTSDRNPCELRIDRFESRYRRLRKNVLTSARLLRDQLLVGGFRYFLAMVTLTYAPGVEWSKDHIPAMQKRIRAWLRYRGYRYAFVWVCELQERGAPHYHLLIWVPYGLRLPKFDQFGWWPHGATRIEQVEKPIGYLIKYLSKGQDSIHRFAKGQRTHGSGGLGPKEKIERRWWLSPGWVKKRWPNHADDLRPAERGGWVNRSTGEWMASPWRFIGWSPLTGAIIMWTAGPRIGVFAAI